LPSPKPEIDEVRGRLQTMDFWKDSSFYQLLREEAFEKGRDEGRKQGMIMETQRLILRLGQSRFGQPDAQVFAVIEAIKELDRLDLLSNRLLSTSTSSWAELLDEP
jgi:hypothetical protein